MLSAGRNTTDVLHVGAQYSLLLIKWGGNRLRQWNESVLSDISQTILKIKPQRLLKALRKIIIAHFTFNGQQ